VTPYAWTRCSMLRGAGTAAIQRMGLTICMDVSSDGKQANAESGAPVMSPGGRYLALTSWAWNLVAGDTNQQLPVFGHDFGV
jgi:hypothetical protein